MSKRHFNYTSVSEHTAYPITGKTPAETIPGYGGLRRLCHHSFSLLGPTCACDEVYVAVGKDYGVMRCLVCRDNISGSGAYTTRTQDQRQGPVFGSAQAMTFIPLQFQTHHRLSGGTAAADGVYEFDSLMFLPEYSSAAGQYRLLLS
jgi:hypothetical protein